ELVVLLQLVARGDGHRLYAVQLEVASFETQLVGAAGDRVVHDRRALAGVLAVDPELGPGERPDGQRAVTRLVRSGRDRGARAGALLPGCGGVGVPRWQPVRGKRVPGGDGGRLAHQIHAHRLVEIGDHPVG